MTLLTAGEWLCLIGAFVLVMLGAAVAAADEAFARFSVVRAESLLDDNPKRAASLVRLLDGSDDDLRNPLRLLLLTCELVHTALIVVVAYRLGGVGWAAAAVLIDAAAVFVFVEAIPRTLAILHTDRVAMLGARPASVLLRLGPMRLAANVLIWITNLIVPGQGLKQGPFSSPEEFLAMADAAVEDEVLEESERDLIESAIEFGDTVVREVMVPRTDMRTISRSATVEEALEVASAAGYSRLPAVGDGADDVVGLVYVKDLIRAELDGLPDQLVDKRMRSPRFIPETKRVAELLREMQQEKFHMAMAVDEYGGIAGLVTLEDLIEELVGEIVDEYDVEEPMVERLVDGSLRVDARILIDELNDLGSMELPEGDWDTVGGLVFDIFGRVPSTGEACEVNGYRLTVEKLQGRRITRVLLRSLQPDSVLGEAS